MDSDASEFFSDCGSDYRDSSTSDSEPCSSDVDDLSVTSGAASGIHLLLLSSGAESPDGSISALVAVLDSPKASVDSLRRAAMELRLLARHNPDNRIRIAESGAVRPLVALLSHPDPLVQEHGVTALLNLSICHENKVIVVEAGAIPPLVRALKSAASLAARENAACALLRLSQLDGATAAAVGRAGAIPLLVSLLETGGGRGKKDAATALYALCSGARENRLRTVEAGAVTPLLDFMSDPESGMVDKAAYALYSLLGFAEGRSATVEEGGISILLELVEVGTSRQKEIATLSLIQICDDNAVYRNMVAREGAIPALVALSQSSSARPNLVTRVNEFLFLLRDSNKQKISTHMGVVHDAVNEVLSSKMLADKGNTKQANSEAETSSSLAVTSAMDAPMSSSLGAVGPLLRKLDSMLPPDYRLPKALKGKIRLLKADLEEISVALVEQSTADSPNEMAKYWMNEVRELCYDIDDFIDSIMSTHADAKMRSVHSYKVGRVKIAWLPKTLKPCTRAAKISDLRALVREAIQRHERYLDGCTSSSRCVFTGHGRIPAMYAEAAHCLVGVDDAKTKLVKSLIDEEQQLKVVAIVGPAGVGKTTLAKQVYHELGERFECQAFVRASRKPDMRRLLGGVLSQVQEHRRPSDSCTVQNLIDSLTKHLQNKRYVVVIDDLWETTAWDIVTSAFPEELPTQMRMLRYLETLAIDAAVSAVPLDIIHLPGLLYLSLGDKTDLPDEIGRIISLRTLHYFDIGSNSEDNVLSLGDLVNLQDLHLTYHTKDSDEHCTEESSERMSICHDVWSSMSSPPIFLQRLELLPPICIFSRLPEWIGQLGKLCILEIVVSEMLRKDMDILTGLPALTVLSLHVWQPMAERVIFKRGTFPALKYFNYTCGAICLSFQEGALPNLKRLELSFNAHRGEDYDHFLAGIEYLLNLKEIAGTIGAAPGAEELDRRAAESAFKDAICNHPRFPSYDYVKRADWIEEEYNPQEKQHLIQYKDSLSEHGSWEKRIVEYIKQNPDMYLNEYEMFCRSQHSAQVLDARSSCSVVTDFSTLASDCGTVTSDSSCMDSADSGSEGAAGVSAYIVECAAFWGLTSISGGSQENCDTAVAVPGFYGLPLFLTGNSMVDGPYPMWFRLPAHFFAVYDGHSGPQDRRTLSGVSWGTVEFKKQWEKAFVDVFCMVDDEVGGKVTRGLAKAAEVEPLAPDHIGSTAVVAVIWFSHIIIANCGDSRAVLCRGKKPVPLTVDHIPNREDEYARIEAAGGNIIQWDGYRVLGVLSVTRSIGDRYLKPWIIPVPEVTVVPRQAEDECLILASDGLWDVLSNQEVCDVARQRILLWHKNNSIASSSAERSGDSSDPAAQAAAEYLSKLARRKGSKDDITVIVVDLKAKRKFKSKLGTPV
ncbi:hypothetical protein ZWY2020_039768 [Hordeum vulgare]|nr:hypothetical protein ZWY2020_039768 [Hordeum vulgare]